MDVSGLVVTGLAMCFELASTLYKYGKQVKGARKDIQSLSNELFGLRGALEHFRLQVEQQSSQEAPFSQPPPYTEIDGTQSEVQDSQDVRSRGLDRGNVASVLAQTVDFLQELQQSLAVPDNGLNAALRSLKWPLRESEVLRHLNRLERVKTFFILSLVTGEMDGSRKMATDIATMRDIIQDASMKQQAIESRNEDKAIIEWLCPVDPHTIQRNIEKLRAPGTGAWFIQSHPFQRLVASSGSSCLWLNGITGAGKTTLIAAAVDEVLGNNAVPFDFAYFYCSFSIDESLYTQNILGSILAQICTNKDAVYQQLRAKYGEMSSKLNSKVIKPDVDVLVEMIIRHAQYRERLYIILDGINECNDPGVLLEALRKILVATKVQLLVSSINEKGIDQCIARMPQASQVILSPESIGSDINLHVNTALETHARLRNLPHDLKEEITMKLTSGAGGMFRWVHLQLDLLSKLRTPGAIRRALTSLPSTLDKTYESLLERVDGDEDRVLTRQILQILAFSLRPLYLEELCAMLQITPGMTALDESKRLTHPKDIIDICGSLLRYNERTGKVTLAHHSVKMFLTTDLQGSASFFKFDAEEAHCFIATLSLTFLSFQAFSVERRERSSELYKDNVFLEYATFNWALHMHAIKNIGQPLWSITRAFLLSGDERRENFINWVRNLTLDSKIAKTTSPLYYAASYGLTIVVEHLLSIGANLEARGGRGRATPINIAAFRGHLDVVKLLDKHGADPSKRDTLLGKNAVQWAAHLRHAEVWQYFKERGYGSLL